MGAPTRRRLRFRCGVLAAGTLLIGVPAGASSQEFHVDTDAERRVVFTSRAAIEEFEGVTERIDGYVLLDGGGIRVGEGFDGAELYFEVDLASLDTGIGLRNRHMRENYLEVESHPFATFAGDVGSIAATGGGFTVRSAGTFSVHGVDRPRTLECGITPDGEGWWVDCGFSVNLTDHDIEIPRIMFLKLAEDIRVDLRFRVRPAPPAQEP